MHHSFELVNSFLMLFTDFNQYQFLQMISYIYSGSLKTCNYFIINIKNTLNAF